MASCGSSEAGSISGAATDDAGKLYFVEHRFQRIYSWTGEAGLNIVQDAPIDPVNIAVDKSGNLLVLSKLGLRQFTEDDLRLLVIYASFAAQAMTNADATALMRE